MHLLRYNDTKCCACTSCDKERVIKLPLGRQRGREGVRERERDRGREGGIEEECSERERVQKKLDHVKDMIITH